MPDTVTVPEATCPVCTANGGSRALRERYGKYVCANCNDEFFISVSTHALDERWAVHTDKPVTENAVLEAWSSADVVPEDPRDWSEESVNDYEFEDYLGHRFIGTQLRYDSETKTALLLKNATIATIVDVPTSRYNCKTSVVQSYVDEMSTDELVVLANSINASPETAQYAVERETRRTS